MKELIEDDVEDKADMEIQIPKNKVKLVIGPGGETIKSIERRTHCKIQHAKDDAEMAVGFGISSIAAAAAAAAAASLEDGVKRATTLKLYGSEAACEAARDLIMEAIENKDQKAKQRAKEYERKREEKRAQRQIYHLRHTIDYEALELPLGASKADVKAAFKKLALKWHPDKNQGSILLFPPIYSYLFARHANRIPIFGLQTIGKQQRRNSKKLAEHMSLSWPLTKIRESSSWDSHEKNSFHRSFHSKEALAT